MKDIQPWAQSCSSDGFLPRGVPLIKICSGFAASLAHIVFLTCLYVHGEGGSGISSITSPMVP
ncbi:hypothetical protein RB213_011168 [Colletotrichum asianum]